MVFLPKLELGPGPLYPYLSLTYVHLTWLLISTLRFWEGKSIVKHTLQFKVPLCIYPLICCPLLMISAVLLSQEHKNRSIQKRNTRQDYVCTVAIMVHSFFSSIGFIMQCLSKTVRVMQFDYWILIWKYDADSKINLSYRYEQAKYLFHNKELIKVVSL